MTDWILQLLILTLIRSTLSSGISLSGEHVCSRVENQTITTREVYTEPIKVQTFTWCFQVPPRCPKTRIELREKFRIKHATEEREIFACCEGYVPEELKGDAATETNPKCVPYCESCKNGICISPNICQCESGYRGDDCAHECPIGSWGIECTEKCNCSVPGESCNPATGICECPAGWQGPGCKLPCPIGRWGFRCESTCDCPDNCDPENGNCFPAKHRDIDGTAADFGPSPASVVSPGTTETTLSKTTSEDRWTTHKKKDLVTTSFETTERSAGALDENGILKTELVLPDFVKTPSTTMNPVELTPFEEIVAETGSDLPLTPPRFSEELRYRDDQVENDLDTADVDGKTDSPQPSYVKTVQKDQVPQISYDITVLIVVGAVVSLCIATLGALMVFYLKSKSFESIPLSIYSSGETNKGDEEKGNGLKSLKITSTTLPPLPTFVNPVFTATTPETALITFDAAELNKHYDNRTATISIRVSRNIRELLEGHYDRPPAATCRHPTVDQNSEHVYDEIPLTAPLCVRKEA